MWHIGALGAQISSTLQGRQDVVRGRWSGCVTEFGILVLSTGRNLVSALRGVSVRKMANYCFTRKGKCFRFSGGGFRPAMKMFGFAVRRLLVPGGRHLLYGFLALRTMHVPNCVGIVAFCCAMVVELKIASRHAGMNVITDCVR